jgi:hypothetical protein
MEVGRSRFQCYLTIGNFQFAPLNWLWEVGGFSQFMRFLAVQEKFESGTLDGFGEQVCCH